MTKGEQIERDLRFGDTKLSALAAKYGVSNVYVWGIKTYGLDGLRKLKREEYHVRARAAGVPVFVGHQRKYDVDRAAVIRAVDAGESYGDVAKRFGITRNVVAGIMNRRPEVRSAA